MSTPGEIRKLELLAPARDREVAEAAILHGADAVYIGPQSFGARAAAGNSIEDIKALCEFAHRFRVRVYATVNTIVYDRELPEVETLVWNLYRAGVDALIVQDMGLLRLNLPPIELHASTQCDTRTPQKARFLEHVGFSQIVLARELSLKEIRSVCETVDVPVECFVHGALCVSYSGRCHASQALCGRSANRGECAQICRLPYDMIDARGRTLARGKHLLSLHDFNATAQLAEMVDAGVTSFKIEGRLKDAAYVKNVTAWYRQRLDEIIAANPGKYCRSSVGKTLLRFKPDPQKSFNRGFSNYFLTERKPRHLASLHTPKSLGEPLADFSDVHNGDGLSFFNRQGEYTGFLVNGMKSGQPVPNRQIQIPKGIQFYRTTDIAWQKLMTRRDTATRLIDIDIELHHNRVEATDARGCHVILPHSLTIEKSGKPQDIGSYFGKLGGSIYRLRNFSSTLPADAFVPASQLTALRREVTQALDRAAEATYSRPLRRPENHNARFPYPHLDYRDNVANRLAADFYREHGASGEAALETRKGRVEDGTTVMTTRHCILRELGMCLQESATRPSLPLTLKGAGRDLRLHFDCKNCEMQVRLGPPPATRKSK